jgi:hypothetical protein
MQNPNGTMKPVRTTSSSWPVIAMGHSIMSKPCYSLRTWRRPWNFLRTSPLKIANKTHF